MTFETIIIVCVLICLVTNMFTMITLSKHLRMFGRLFNQIVDLKEKIHELDGKCK